MVQIKAIYQGKKHCQAQHEPSGSLIETDAPKDNQGLGEKFSPTDLMATSLGTCILTTVAIFAEKEGLNLVHSNIEVEKVMASNPRRIFSLNAQLKLSKEIPLEFREKIKIWANECPVKKSLHPDISALIEIEYVL